MNTYRTDWAGREYFFEVDRRLTAQEQIKLDAFVYWLPYPETTSIMGWNWELQFAQFDFDNYPDKELLKIAANAYTDSGHTVLGVACQSANVDVVERLISLGADVNAIDQYFDMPKLPLYWAINNRLSSKDRGNDEAARVVECLLKNGARTDISCYQNVTLQAYAEDRGYTAAVRLFQQYSQPKKITASVNVYPGSLFANSSSDEAAESIKEQTFNPGESEGTSYYPA